MGFRPLEEIIGPITLTLRGREYTLPVIMIDQGQEISRRIAEGMTLDELAKALLGDVLSELVAAAAPLEAINRVTLVSLAEWRMGREAAERVWNDSAAYREYVAAIQKQVAPKTAAPASRARKRSSARTVQTGEVPAGQGPVG